VEQALESIELARLERVHTEINLRQQWEVFDELKLVYLLDVVEVQV
jgi:hypothetical protein